MDLLLCNCEIVVQDVVFIVMGNEFYSKLQADISKQGEFIVLILKAFKLGLCLGQFKTVSLSSDDSDLLIELAWLQLQHCWLLKREKPLEH